MPHGTLEGQVVLRKLVNANGLEVWSNLGFEPFFNRTDGTEHIKTGSICSQKVTLGVAAVHVFSIFRPNVCEPIKIR
jgi:hypothetical protein